MNRFTLTINNCTRSKQLEFDTELETLWQMDCHAAHFVQAGFRVEFRYDLFEMGIDPPCMIFDAEGVVGCMFPGIA
jgi:hypothetical protein